MEQIAPARIEVPVAARMSVERVSFEAPWHWLAADWRDIWSAPRISLLYGGAFALLSVAT